ncbi:NAD(P)-dependent oxidoreductase [Rhizobium sp. L1K21]|uniref:NAD-dependent epimerase/dehydratase family protein n=1 Tax=Rhizobium sp. L1K21 TaxID=2954933 RepID=UPI002093075C|nr:NAD-dependent epimerase/dehydratase family protein [Rhizobium sp. L1K21]MCO6187810.1 NAD-dependent epimerase/dehydratase family protein [Rhizobium sp. L1K21]
MGESTTIKTGDIVQRVLVTGGSGFIGRHVSRELAENGYKVRIIDSLVDQVHGGEPINIVPGTELIHADIRDSKSVQKALDGVDAVIHLAAEVGVGQSMYEIARYVGANDLGTAVLLEALIENPVKRVVVASSMSVYGEGLYEDDEGRRYGQARRNPKTLEAGNWDIRAPNGEPLKPLPTDEEKQVELASIYALTKYMQEKQVLIFGEAYGVETVALRLFNVFGAGQALSNPYTGVLVNFASRLATGETPMIFEDGHQKRDFVHVKDVAMAFRLALERPDVSGEVFNIGSGQAYAIADVARLLAQEMGMPERAPEILNKARKGDIRHCFADISKAQSLLGFRPRHLLENSLKDFTTWVKTSAVVDKAPQMRQELEARGLVS